MMLPMRLLLSPFRTKCCDSAPNSQDPLGKHPFRSGVNPIGVLLAACLTEVGLVFLKSAHMEEPVMNPLRALFLGLSRMPPALTLILIIGLAVVVSLMVANQIDVAKNGYAAKVAL